MFGRPKKIGRLFGIDITVSWSFLLLVGLLVLFYGLGSGGSIVAGIVGVLLSLALLFGSVLLHEIGHSLVARRLGVHIAEIELHIFGGAAKMLSMPKSPRDEMLIAGAGPAVSFLLAGAFGVLHLVFGPVLSVIPVVGGLLAGLLSYGALINLLLGGFNLLPALPMDGGRILRAALATRLGNVRATEIAVIVARVIAVGMGIVGVLSPGHRMLIALAVFVWFLGSRELRLARMLASYGQPGTGAVGASASPAGFEVLDRQGSVVRSYGAHPGAAPIGAAPFPSGPRVVWTEAPTHAAPKFQVQVQRRSVVRGPDGRLWIVSQR